MKKGYVSGIFMLVLPLCIVNSFQIAMAKENLSLEQIATKMMSKGQITPIYQTRSVEGATDKDEAFYEKFNSLFIDEKNTVLNIMRNKDRKGKITPASQEQEDFIKGLEEYAKQKGKSVIELTEKEIQNYKKVLQMQRAWGLQNGIVSCKSAYFPDVAYFNNIPSWATPYSGTYVEAVANSINETNCDYGIHFPISSNNITASSIRGRNLLRGFFGKVNKQTNSTHGDFVLIGAGRADVLYGMITFSGSETGDRLRQELQLWK